MRLVLRVWLLLSLFLLTSCQTPFLVFPGRALSGEVTHVDSFAFAQQFKLLRLETYAESPYSVILRTTVINDRLFIDAAPSRKWAKHIQMSPRVRIKLGKLIYPANVLVVSDADITERFLIGRTIYEVVPRDVGPMD